MATAAATVGAASGIRAWLATRAYAWVTPLRMKRMTIALMAGAVALAASGSSPAP